MKKLSVIWDKTFCFIEGPAFNRILDLAFIGAVVTVGAMLILIGL